MKGALNLLIKEASGKINTKNNNNKSSAAKPAKSFNNSVKSSFAVNNSAK